MLEILFAAGILDVQVVAVFDDPFYRHQPGPVVLLPVVPPGEADAELLKLDLLGLGVILPTLGERLFVVPDFLGRAGTVEEEEVGGDAGIGCDTYSSKHFAQASKASSGVPVQLPLSKRHGSYLPLP